MILVVGGYASGKRSYAQGLGFASDQMADGVLDDLPVLLNLQDALVEDPRTPEQIADALASKKVVTCCEVGSGIVPVDARERAWREKVGRTCTILADRADSVVRMVCGIPVTLK